MLLVPVAMLMVVMQGCGSGEKIETLPGTDAASEVGSDNSSGITSNTTECIVTAAGTESLPSLLQGAKDGMPVEVRPLIPTEIKEGDSLSPELLTIMARFLDIEQLKGLLLVEGACKAPQVVSGNSNNTVSNTECTVTAKGSASMPSLLQGVKGLIPADIKPLIPSEIKEGDAVSPELLKIMEQFQQLRTLLNQGWIEGACQVPQEQVPALAGNASAGVNSSNNTRRWMR